MSVCALLCGMLWRRSSHHDIFRNACSQFVQGVIVRYFSLFPPTDVEIYNGQLYCYTVAETRLLEPAAMVYNDMAIDQ